MGLKLEKIQKNSKGSVGFKVKLGVKKLNQISKTGWCGEGFQKIGNKLGGDHH